MIPVHYLYENSYWDMALLRDILDKPPFTRHFDPDKAVLAHVFVLPGASNVSKVKEVNKEINKYKGVVLIITSDEESLFPVEEIKHPNIRIYIQYPKRGRHDQYKKWPLGYTTETRKNLEPLEKDLDYYFSGQITHGRRKDMAKFLNTIPHGETNYTDGFSKGLAPKDYMLKLQRAKIAPAPAGPVSADSFRLYEALESGAIPIGDNISEAGDENYWEYLLGSVPFPTINHYEDLPGYVEDALHNYQHKANKIQAWYIQLKQKLFEDLVADVNELAELNWHENISVVIPVSPIRSHPDIKILEETVSTIRTHLPEVKLFITFDGVRPEHEHRRADYEEFTRRALFRCNTDWNAIPYIFDNHEHQTGMMRELLPHITSNMILYVEQDTPLTPDLEIDWNECAALIMNGVANVIRFHFEAEIPKEHTHMMIGEIEGFIATCQWSQRPHLASTAYYKRILKDYFTPNARSFIEDKMHSVLHQAYLEDGQMGWHQHKLFIYKPKDHLKRSYHLDGREGEAKYDDTQIF